MRYTQGGGLTAQQRTKREHVRLRAAELFARGDTDAQVAKAMRVSRMSANRRRRTWARGGPGCLGLLRRRVRPDVESASGSDPGPARGHAGGQGAKPARGPDLGGRAALHGLPGLRRYRA
ncbi:helix-turn-helix domain-containing protein [Planobispora longispora]|uniref:helix-turn-helix domain-containing protein n=1 Tax=Planobispora longispora TaxID=28887 RepID=UPI0019420BBA|nr:helix-turn-helix domain-containing protein [Planobispora longispora]